jgi:hypothetical protein
MAKFLAVHTLQMTQEQFMSMGQEAMHKIPKGFTYKLTYCAFDEHKFFCEWDAPSKEALAQGFKTLNMPVDFIYPVKVYEVATGKWS